MELSKVSSSFMGAYRGPPMALEGLFWGGFRAKGVGFRGRFKTIFLWNFKRAWGVKGLAFEGLGLYKVVYGIKQEVC